MMSLTLGTHALGVRIETRVTPRASRNGIQGVRDGRLLVTVTAPPVDRAANVAVVEVISDALGLPRRDVTIVAGDRSRNKSVVLSGVNATEVARRLSAILGTSV
jgi:uncharacterized protein (TIGR00251 family)